MFDENVKLLGSENENMLKDSITAALKTIPQDAVIVKGAA